MAGRAGGQLLPVLLLLGAGSVSADSNRQYSVAELCRSHFLQEVNRIIDGATVWSQNERNLSCQLTFQTEAILQRLMVRFDKLHLDCNDHLYIHDGAHAISGNHKADLSCRNTKESVGTLYTRSNFVTLNYKTDGWGTSRNGFKIVITAFKPVSKNQAAECDGFVCQRHCISSHLQCDGVVHCPDGGDESVRAGCVDAGLVPLLGVDQTLLVGALAGAAVVIVATSLTVVVCYCRRSRRRRDDSGALNAHRMSAGGQAAANGLGSGHPKSTSENWRCPAARTGSPPRTLCSPLPPEGRGHTETPAGRRMSGLCRGWSLRRGAWSAGPGSRAHIAHRCDVIGGRIARTLVVGLGAI
ncbi:uncharacterized protein LOC119099470 [Pollicipes pollicipes]|uniref:uncharacterized protein LOC119099470 n=1 Tax=Pollicipes pollicipes TaxID=41117 RepID=UPI0018859DDD|nr:uncharacterized protein LOC119099470 [Pollicipes pollicipes]